jgi:alanine racemase
MNPTKAVINLANLQYNFKAVKIKTKTKVMAVVKANAYGYGMIESVKALEKLKDGPEYYGVALLEEGIELRKAKVTKKPILCFSPFQPDDINKYIRYRIIPSISTPEQIDTFQQLKLKNKISVHVNINTGMNRLGINYKDALDLIKKIRGHNKINIDGIYTHFATSDEKNKEFANLQMARFNKILNNLRKNKINYGLAHISNSGAILDMPNSYHDMVRLGMSLYGYYPSQETTESLELKPVMSIVSKLSTIYTINNGESVGYGRLFTASGKTKCATIPIGYADGVLRGLSNEIKVIINDGVYDQIGRISMDRISIKLKNKVEIKINEEVILLGESKNHKITAWDWCKILKTIPYEITCSISNRVPRKYIGKI